jgi:DNA-binding PadR family transcriptional regulator
MDILPIRKLYILGFLIKVSRTTLPKPKGTTGATKMKIMAIVCHYCDCGKESYGYVIWQSLKDYFHMYINDCDVRNVYHHLKELCELELLERIESLNSDASKRCLYQLTEKGRDMRIKYAPYLEILHRGSGYLKK